VRETTNYPIGDYSVIIARIAEYTNVLPANVILSAGSDEVLRAVVDTCGLRNQTKVLMAAPGYSHFLQYTKLRGLAIDTYDAADGLRGVSEYLRTVDPSDSLLVYLGNPNNPVGGHMDAQSVKVVSDAYPDCTFIVDEAYIEFCGLEYSATSLCLQCPNLIVTRTFSKAFGLAGLRIGYGVGHIHLVAQISIALSPKALRSYEVRVAESVMGQVPYYLELAQQTRIEIARVMKILAQDGWSCKDGEGNFFCVYVGNKVATAVRFLLEMGICVRNRDDQPGLKGFLRVTGGTREDMDSVIATLRCFRDKYPVTVYVDGIFDLFHFGHIQFLKQAKALGGATARLLVGVISDEDAAWKRRPIVDHADRCEMLKHCTIADKIVDSAPLILTKPFLEKHAIDLVVHGDDSDQAEFFEVPIQMGIMRYVPYTPSISTTTILHRVSSQIHKYS
jgi:histidinol-phosphate aminotransferase